MENTNYYNSQQNWQNSWDPNYYPHPTNQTAPPPPPPSTNPNPHPPYSSYSSQPSNYPNWSSTTGYPGYYDNNIIHPAPPQANPNPPPSNNSNVPKKYGKATSPRPYEGKPKFSPYQLAKPIHKTNKPAYTKVAAQKNLFAPPKSRNVFEQHNSQTESQSSSDANNTPSSTTQTNNSEANSGPMILPAMKTWFGKLFEKSPPNSHTQLHSTLSTIIYQFLQTGKQYSLNWEKLTYPKFTPMDSPEMVSQKLLDHLNPYLNTESAQSHGSTNNSSLLSNTSSNQKSNTNTKSKKPPKNNPNQHKRSDQKMSPNPHTNTVNSFDHDSSHKSSNTYGTKSKNHKSKSKLSEDISQMRLQNYSSPPKTEEPTFVGTNTSIEKRYLRLTTAPVASNVRPLYILEKTFALLNEKANDGATYPYLCDQFKSMRQDLQVQRIRTRFTLQVYETHARLAIISGDMGEYNQCQTQLRELFETFTCENLPEFTAYRILYFIFTRNFTELNQLMSKLPLALKQEPAVHHAFSIYSCIANSNYIRLFKLYQQSPNLSQHMINQFIERERITALTTILRSTLAQMKIKLDTLLGLLKFSNLDECREFLEKYECKLDPDDDNLLLGYDANQVPLIKATQKYQVVDIKGQI